MAETFDDQGMESTHRDHARWAPLGILAINLLIVAAFAPAPRRSTNFGEAWRVFMAGYVLSQPVIYAAWGALSRGHRLYSTVNAFYACNAVVTLFAIRSRMPDAVLFSSALFAYFWVVIARRNRGYVASIRPINSPRPSAAASKRFSTFDILYVMTAIAVLLGSLGAAAHFSPTLVDTNLAEVAGVVAISLFYVIGLLPVLGLGGIVLGSEARAGRPASRMVVLAALAVAFGLVLLLFWPMAIAYLGACLSVGGAAYLLRLAGYRLIEMGDYMA